MQRTPFKRVVSAFAAGLALAATARAADPRAPNAAISAEVARLRDVVGTLPEPMVGADERKQMQQQLATLDELLQAGRSAGALHGLLRSARYVDAQAFRAANAARFKEGMPALEGDFPRYDEERRQKLQGYAAKGTAVARALTETAAYESRIVHEACLVYGAQVGVESGYFYLGEARALLAFALFASGQKPEAPKPPPNPAPLASRLVALEQRLLDAYAGKTATPQANAFARANGALKLARELDREKALWGALYQYLLAEQALGQARAPTAVKEAGELRRAIDTLAQRLASAKTDHSVALALVQVAQNGLRAPDPKPALVNAQVIAEVVVPAYLELVGEKKR